jgi:hypothetical protein
MDTCAGSAHGTSDVRMVVNVYVSGAPAFLESLQGNCGCVHSNNALAARGQQERVAPESTCQIKGRSFRQ